VPLSSLYFLDVYGSLLQLDAYGEIIWVQSFYPYNVVVLSFQRIFHFLFFKRLSAEKESIKNLTSCQCYKTCFDVIARPRCNKLERWSLESFPD